jgi:hypothetical protein
MLIYRLLHADDLFKEVPVNIDGRALELAGPTIDLFYALSKDKILLKTEILPVLSTFLREKGEISENSLDNIIYNVVKGLSDDTNVAKDGKGNFKVSHQTLYDKVKDASSGEDIKTGTFDSPTLGEVSKTKISRHCRDKLSAENTSIGTGNAKRDALLFNTDTIKLLEDSYKVVTEIKLLEDEDDDDDNTENHSKSKGNGNDGDNDTSSLGALEPLGPSTGVRKDNLTTNNQAIDAQTEHNKRDNLSQNTLSLPLNSTQRTKRTQ